MGLQAETDSDHSCQDLLLVCSILSCGSLCRSLFRSQPGSSPPALHNPPGVLLKLSTVT